MPHLRTQLFEMSWCAARQGITHNALSSDGTNVYYSRDHWIIKAPIGGGAPTILVPDLASAGGGAGYVLSASRPSVSGGYVYWINYGYVFKVPVGGGTPEALVAQSLGDQGYAITDGMSVYHLNGGSLWKVPVTGGTPVSLIDAAKGYALGDGPMILDETSVYVLAYNETAIVKIAK